MTWEGLTPPYRTIVADPPWPVSTRMGSGGRRARPTEVPYEPMTVAAIAALPVAEIADEDGAHLYLWSTRRAFREGDAVAVARAWGFEPAGEFIWGLRNPGMGGALGSGHEPVLIARRGKLAFPPNHLPVSVVFWKQPYGHGKLHSAKPAGFGDLVEDLSPGPYVELFCRQPRFGWDSWGHGYENFTSPSTQTRGTQ